MAGKQLRLQFWMRQVPQPHGAITAATGEELAVGAETPAGHPAFMSAKHQRFWLPELAVRVEIPDVDFLVPTASGDTSAVGAEDHAVDHVRQGHGAKLMAQVAGSEDRHLA